MRGKRLAAVVSAFMLSVSTNLYSYHQSFSIRLRSAVLICPQMPCFVDPERVFRDNWDKIVVVEPTASDQAAERAIGQFAKRPDLMRMVVFLHDGNVYRRVFERTGIEHPENGEVVFPDEVDGVFTIKRGDQFVHAVGDLDTGKYHVLLLAKPGVPYI